MPRMLAVVGFVCVLGAHTVAHGQSPQVRRLVGNRIGGLLQWDKNTQKTTDTRTLTFVETGDTPAFTVDFVAQYLVQAPDPRPRSTPSAVDIVITQFLVDEDTPEMAAHVNGQSLPLVTRLRGRRSIVTTISFDEFVQLANADTIVYHAFDADLELGAAQRGLLRSLARQWARR